MDTECGAVHDLLCKMFACYCLVISSDAPRDAWVCLEILCTTCTRLMIGSLIVSFISQRPSQQKAE